MCSYSWKEKGVITRAGERESLNEQGMFSECSLKSDSLFTNSKRVAILDKSGKFNSTHKK